MIYNRLILTLLISSVSAVPSLEFGNLPPGPSSEPVVKRDDSVDTVLLPAIHWDHDHTDLNHLRPRDTAEMFYSEHNDPTRPQQIAMSKYELSYPSVPLEHSSYVHRVSCSSANSMSVYFNDQAAYEYAHTHWKGYGGDDKMTFIGYFKSCEPSFKMGHRSWSLVHDLKWDEEAKVVTAVVDHVDVKKAIKRASFDLGTYQPNKRDDGRMAADFGQWGADFDTKLDKQHGLMARNRLAKRGPFDSVLGLINDVKDKAKQAFSDAKDNIVKLGDTLKQGAKEFADKIKNPFIQPHTLEKFKTMEVNKTNAEDPTPFKDRKGKQIFDALGVTFYCVDCGINGKATFGGSITFSVAHGIESGYISFDGNLKTSLAFGIVNQNPYLWVPVASFSKKIFPEIAIPGLSIPGLYRIGPSLSVDAELDIGIGFTGQILLGFEMEWPRAVFHYDFKDKSKSTSSGWKPNFNPIVEVHGNLSINAAIGPSFGINFGVDLFNGEIDVSLRLAEKPTLTTWLKQNIDLEYVKDTASDADLATAQKAAKELDGHFKGNISGAGNCPGAVFSYLVSIDTVLTLIWKALPIEPPFQIPPLYLFRGILLENEKCLKFGLQKMFKVKRAFTDRVKSLFGGSGKVSLTNIMCSSGYLTLAHAFNGNTYVDTTPEDNVVDDPVFKFSQVDGYVVGDSEDRLFHIETDTLTQHGVSRIRLAKEENKLEGTSKLIFAPENCKGTKVLLGYTENGKTLFPIACAYESQPPKLFVAQNLEEGLKTLASKNMQNMLTGGNVVSCQFIAWKTGNIKSWWSKRDAIPESSIEAPVEAY